GLHTTQTTEPTRTNAAIVSEIAVTDAFSDAIIANTATGGSEPNVPGAPGRKPRPRQDVSKRFSI
ncbi:MAG: hypothetical protein ACYST9_04480, partial [Planctomycetota bacterium]